MNKLASRIACAFLVIFSVSATIQQTEDSGQFAPADAYLEGSRFPYFGSENAWDRRFFSAAEADKDYKRRGQRQLLEILAGRPDKAVELCESRLAKDPGDPDAYFMLAVAHAQLNQLDKAVAAVRQALANGLPLERFLAGPRDLLRPLTDTAAFQEIAKQHPTGLIHGPLLGAVTDRSARFWVRTWKEAAVVVRVFKDGRRIAEADGKTRADQDYTGVIQVEGLQPATRYSYDVVLNSRSALQSSLPSFETFPSKAKPARFRVGFGGGAGFTPAYERMWNTILERDPRAFLFLGDNVYVDLPEMPGAFHDYSYYCRQSRPEFRKLIGTTATYAIWDDHDCAIDDVWMGPYVDKPAWKKPTWDLFRRNWNNPGYGDKKWPGCWFSCSLADVDFIMLDCRFYRTNPFQAPRTMLGPVQKAWLLEQLKQSRATFKIIVSSVPWASGAKPGAKDTWDGFPEEREEIFSFIEKQRIEGAILLSADRHRSDAWRIDRQGGYPLYEFMSSRLTNIHTHELMPGALFGYNEKCSFGLLSFDTTPSHPAVTFDIVNIDGEVVHSLTLRRSQLGFD